MVTGTKLQWTQAPNTIRLYLYKVIKKRDNMWITSRPFHFVYTQSKHHVQELQLRHSNAQKQEFVLYNKVRELIAVKLQHSSLLNTTVVAFKVLPLGRYAPMPAPNPTFKTILELVLCNGLQSCHCITPDVINVIKSLPFNISFIFANRKKSLGARSGE